MSSTTLVRLFDGEAQPIEKEWALITAHAFGVSIFRRWVRSPVILPAGRGRGLSVIAHVPGYRDGAFGPFDQRPEEVPLMLLPKKSRIRFPRKPRTEWAGLLPVEEYDEAREQRPLELACILNVLAACEPLGLTPEIREIEWNTARQDRFWAWCTPALVSAVERFAPAPKHLHPGATRSFKQTGFLVANLQFTLHENDEPPAGLDGLVRVEFDMDYYRDPLAHLLLEVAEPGLTHPATIYKLRWMAGRLAGEAPFAPFVVD